MYEKELLFYEQLRDEVHQFIPCPKILGCFKDKELQPDKFCIAMEGSFGVGN